MKLNAKKQIDFWIGGFALILIYLPVRLLSHILKRDHSLKNVKHILFVKLLGGGSLSMLIPVVYELRKSHPQCVISVLCGQSIKHFAKDLNLFDQILVIDDSSILKLFFYNSKKLFFYAHQSRYQC